MTSQNVIVYSSKKKNISSNLGWISIVQIEHFRSQFSLTLYSVLTTSHISQIPPSIMFLYLCLFRQRLLRHVLFFSFSFSKIYYQWVFIVSFHLINQASLFPRLFGIWILVLYYEGLCPICFGSLLELYYYYYFICLPEIRIFFYTSALF